MYAHFTHPSISHPYCVSCLALFQAYPWTFQFTTSHPPWRSYPLTSPGAFHDPDGVGVRVQSFDINISIAVISPRREVPCSKNTLFSTRTQTKTGQSFTCVVVLGCLLVRRAMEHSTVTHRRREPGPEGSHWGWSFSFMHLHLKILLGWYYPLLATRRFVLCVKLWGTCAFCKGVYILYAYGCGWVLYSSIYRI